METILGGQWCVLIIYEINKCNDGERLGWKSIIYPILNVVYIYIYIYIFNVVLKYDYLM